MSPANPDAVASGGGTPERPPRYPELHVHADAIYDQLCAGHSPREAGPLLDIGSGDGAALAAIVEGTGMRGVALDRRPVHDWFGPVGFQRLTAEAEQLPFPAGSFGASLLHETWEWLANPAAVLAEMARVTRERLVVVQTDWRSLWFDSGDPETAREFTRLFAGPAAPGRARASALLPAGVRLCEETMATVRGDRLQRGTYAFELLRLLREYLVVQRAGVRARRFDEWRKDLDARAAAGAFAFSLERRVVVAEVTGG